MKMITTRNRKLLAKWLMVYQLRTPITKSKFTNFEVYVIKIIHKDE